MTYVENIFKLMIKKQISINLLSKAIGVSQGNVSDWKSGRSKPNVDALLKIADYLDVSVDYLLGRTDKTEVNK